MVVYIQSKGVMVALVTGGSFLEYAFLVKIFCFFSDINITTPSFREYSYLSFSLAKIKIHLQTSITLTFSTPAVNGILFYVTRDITSLSGDFLSITLHDR